jgi:hypothetical protein
MSANPEPLFEATDRRHYYYRRRLTVGELLPAIAVGVGAGLAAFYLTRLMAQRTPLVPSPGHEPARRGPRGIGGRG